MSAPAAPASTMTSPRGFIAAIQVLRARAGSVSGRNQGGKRPRFERPERVQPCALGDDHGSRPPAIAVRAAMSFVFMPPLARPGARVARQSPRSRA